MAAPAGTWSPRDFAHPTRVELRTGRHLRPMRPADTEVDHPAVMGSRERLWTVYGEAWGRPPADLTVEQDRQGPRPPRARDRAHESSLHGLFDGDEAQLLGCVCIDPPTEAGDVGAEVPWWVVDRLVGSDVERELDDFVPRWVAERWPLPAPARLVGWDVSWAGWNALPARA